MGSKNRVVRADRFSQQLTEQVVGEDSLVGIEVAEGDIVKIKIPVLLDEECMDYPRRLADADTERDRALVVLGYNPERDAEEQLAAVLAAGYTIRDIAAWLTAETQTAQEALGKFRYRG